MKYEWLDAYLLSKTGVYKDFKEEWNWIRYLLNGKMIAAQCRDKTGKNIITLKCDPLFGEKLRIRYDDVKPGYYMNKTHWNSVCLDGTVPDEILQEMIDQSYNLTFNKFSKKVQKEIRVSAE